MADEEDFKIYKGKTPYNVWYVIKYNGQNLFLCYEDPVNFTQTQCVPPEEVYETSWLDILVTKGITKKQILEWVYTQAPTDSTRRQYGV